jgi:hypothetical protein
LERRCHSYLHGHWNVYFNQSYLVHRPRGNKKKGPLGVTVEWFFISVIAFIVGYWMPSIVTFVSNKMRERSK